MIYKNAELYNVSELLKQKDGSLSMLRMPLAVEETMCKEGRSANRNGCGKEIRFNLNGDRATIRMKVGGELKSGMKFSRALVYYGSIAAGYPECVKDIGADETVIGIINSDKIEWLKKFQRKTTIRMIRVLLDLCVTQ